MAIPANIESSSDINNSKVAAVTNTKRINRNLLRKETSFAGAFH